MIPDCRGNTDMLGFSSRLSIVPEVVKPILYRVHVIKDATDEAQVRNFHVVNVE